MEFKLNTRETAFSRPIRNLNSQFEFEIEFEFSFAVASGDLWSLFWPKLRGHFLHAVRADAVAEAGVGSGGDVGFHAFPEFGFVADAFAIRADRDQALECVDLGQGLFQLGDLCVEGVLQRNHAQADAETGAQLFGLEWLDDVVIGASLQTGYDVGGIAAAGQQDDIVAERFRRAPDAAAELGSVNTRHHPVDNSEARRIGLAQDIPRLLTIVDDNNLVSPVLEHGIEQHAGNGVVVGDQDFHVVISQRP